MNFVPDHCLQMWMMTAMVRLQSFCNYLPTIFVRREIYEIAYF